jgi:hypothetical protein
MGVLSQANAWPGLLRPPHLGRLAAVRLSEISLVGVANVHPLLEPCIGCEYIACVI